MLFRSYIAGSTSRVRRVEVISPPMTTVANGRCTSAPSPVESAIGRNPIDATRAVMSTGRRRNMQLSIILSCMACSVVGALSACLSCCSRSIRFICPMSTMPLSTATPNSAMKPTPADMENGMPRSHSAQTPPMAARGMAENTNSDSRTFFTVVLFHNNLL